MCKFRITPRSTKQSIIITYQTRIYPLSSSTFRFEGHREYAVSRDHKKRTYRRCIHKKPFEFISERAMFVDGFLATPFAHNVLSRYNSTESRHRRLGSDGCDVRLILNGLELRVHGAVLGQPFVLFHEMIFASSVGEDGLITLDVGFIYSDVLDVLVKFCYLMTAPSFSLDEFLGLSSKDKSWEPCFLDCLGEPWCQVYLFSVLSFLGESQLRGRVRWSFAATPPPTQPQGLAPRWIDDIRLL
jgi:hypothetical protein